MGHELLQLPSVSLLVRDEGGAVLLVRHAEGVWVAPGGLIEPGETPAEAAVREAREEIGCGVRLIRVTGVYGGPDFVVRYGNGDVASYVMIAFEAALLGRPVPGGEETRAVGFFTSDEIARLSKPAWLAPVVGDLLAGSQTAQF